MTYKLLRVLLIAILTLLPLSAVRAQTDENTIPLYVRYCNPTRLIQGDDELDAALGGLEERLTALEDLLARIENGGLTYLEGIAQSEQALAEWAASPIQQISCLAPLNRDVTTLLNEILIAMLYGQIVETNASALHLSNARSLIERIRQEGAAAARYLEEPVPTPEAETIAEPDAEPAATALPEGTLRAADELTTLLGDYLLNNGVVVLSNAGVQPFPDNVVINIALDRFVLDGQPLDLENSLFTLDVLSGLLADWPELSQITTIRIETFDGATRTLVVAATGDNFRAHYYDGTLNRADFEASLIITEG